MAQSKLQQLRIIGGKWRGRKLNFPPVAAIRPTPDRVRETLFNWLQGTIVNSDCLDLFSGSAALGLEALSRGASSVSFVEHEHQAINYIHQHLQTLQAANATVNQADVLAYLRREPEKQFDIVFLDPPFHQNLLAPCFALLEQQNWLKDEAWIYMEAEDKLDDIALPGNWSIHRSKKAGNVGYHLAIRQKPCEDGSDEGRPHD